MSDFTKEKIGFAVALLATIFTITPVIDALGAAGFAIFGVSVQIKHLFYLISCALGLSVYCYGVQFLTELELRPTRLLGDTFYALAMVAPVLYVILFGGVQVAVFLGSVLNSGLVKSFGEGLSGVGAGVISAMLGRLLESRLKQKEKDSSVQTLREQGVTRLQTAQELFRANHFDLAVIETFRAVESAARREAISQDRPLPRRWVDELRAHLPTPDVKEAFEQLRRIRNVAAHAVEPVSEDQARNALATASKILAFLEEEEPPNSAMEPTAPVAA